LRGAHHAVLTDSIASFSRRLAQTKARKIAELLFRYYPVKRGVTTIHDFDGDLSILLDRASYISSAIYWAGHHSLPLVRFLRRFLKPEMTLADVGANIGEITLFAGKKLTQGRVLAFEPMPAVFSELALNVALNHFASSVEMFNVGLFDRDGTMPLYVKEDQPFGTTNKGVTSIFSTGRDRQVTSVPLRRFDDIAAECRLERLDVMKLDVEGAEWMVLRGAENSIKRFRPVIIVEISASTYGRAGYSPRDLFSYFESLAYDLRNLEDGSTKLPSECDALCVPREMKAVF
jgi:FkbM family methyltransferase